MTNLCRQKNKIKCMYVFMQSARCCTEAKAYSFARGLLDTNFTVSNDMQAVKQVLSFRLAVGHFMSSHRINQL